MAERNNRVNPSHPKDGTPSLSAINASRSDALVIQKPPAEKTSPGGFFYCLILYFLHEEFAVDSFGYFG